jgi:hypothetical protein
MQDAYAGDIGDFGKFAILRALGAGRRLGVCWYLATGGAAGDGKHLQYLDQPKRFRHLDEPLFDELVEFRRSFQSKTHPRSVAELERRPFLPPGTLFHRAPVPSTAVGRPGWRLDMVQAVAAAEFIFLDPDNGLEGQQLSSKSAAMDELVALAQGGRPLLFYNHQTRMAGGAQVEVAHLATRFRGAGFSRVDAVRLRPYSSRYYLLLNADPPLVQALDDFAKRWAKEAVRFR